ncbi:hypothetical protein Cylst_1320 [Cylindrospermum stagnale PCC 7417]|uniref:DUF3800 domain-containing protein n=1 Tax=Cylindrospermum stagnale PCC 7417 TaxID=56107 RepID=K9WTC3_9NOST|nr:DUF3800 domain-containing protein [Cylindrospermum stagnale]AFZ23610.1 hypothetical protein Cylst_1320 [Cylindrospermum stagnale PCC 7417]
MTLYFYADETKFYLDNHDGTTTNAYGYGVLITRYSVEDTSVIIEALNNLRQDPDINKPEFIISDKRTLDRAYFHASDDSQNAHSHLCTAIREYIQGKFRYDYDDKNKYEDILTLSCLEFTCRNEPIVLVVEQRIDFQQPDADKWKEDAYRDIEKSLVKLPDSPAYFPEIKVEIKKKENAGLQVTDFILWAINRTKKKKPDTKWYDRLKFVSSSSFQIENNLFTGGEYILKQDLYENISYFRYPQSCFPLKDLPNNFLDLVDLYLFIEQQLLKIHCGVIPNHVLHLQDKLTKAVKNFNFTDKGQLNNTKIIQKIASIYIRLFDTFPLYQNLLEDDSSQWSKFLLSRKFASKLLFQEDSNVQIFCHQLVEYKLRNSSRG